MRILCLKIRYKAPKLTIFYDEFCPLCRTTRIILSHFDICKAFNFSPIQELEQKKYPQLKNISQEYLLKSIYSLDSKTNTVKEGVDTYIRIFNLLFFIKPLSWILRLPGVYHLVKIIYKNIAKNRPTECLDGVCSLGNPNTKPTSLDNVVLLQNFTFGDLKVKLITFSILSLLILQLNSSLAAPLPRTLAKKLIKTEDKTPILHSGALLTISKLFAGITPHGVFMDHHFDEYNHIIAVKYLDRHSETYKFLPINDKKGKVSFPISGRLWVKWAFRVNSPRIKQKRLEKGLIDFTAFFAHKMKLNLNDCTFKVVVKIIEKPSQWVKDYAKSQEGGIWINAGTITWKDKSPIVRIKDIERVKIK